MMIYVSGAQKYIDETNDVLVTEWPYRTTVAWDENNGWTVLELCEKFLTWSFMTNPLDDHTKVC